MARGKGIESYLPLKKVLKQWSDRKKWVEEPLFRSYIFIHADLKGRASAPDDAVEDVILRGQRAQQVFLRSGSRKVKRQLSVVTGEL